MNTCVLLNTCIHEYLHSRIWIVFSHELPQNLFCMDTFYVWRSKLQKICTGRRNIRYLTDVMWDMRGLSLHNALPWRLDESELTGYLLEVMYWVSDIFSSLLRWSLLSGVHTHIHEYRYSQIPLGGVRNTAFLYSHSYVFESISTHDSCIQGYAS